MLIFHLLLHISIRSEEHTSELQSHLNLVCRLLLEKKNKTQTSNTTIERQRASPSARELSCASPTSSTRVFPRVVLRSRAQVSALTHASPPGSISWPSSRAPGVRYQASP